MRGPGPRDEPGTRPDPNCPAHLQQGRSCCAPSGRRPARNRRGAPLGPQGYGGGGARCSLSARTDKAWVREARGPQPPANPSPHCPKPGPGSTRDGVKGSSRMREPVLTKPTGAGAGEHGPAGPGAPAGRQGREAEVESPQRPRRRTLNQRAKSAQRGAPEPPGRRRMRSRWGVHALPEPASSCTERKYVSAGEPGVRFFR